MNFKNVLAIDNLDTTTIPSMEAIYSKAIQCDQDLFIAGHFLVSNTSMSAAISVFYEVSVDNPTSGQVPKNWLLLGEAFATQGQDGLYPMDELTDFAFNWIRIGVLGGGDVGNVSVRLNIKGF